MDVDKKDEDNIHVNAQKALMNELEGFLPLCSGKSGHLLGGGRTWRRGAFQLDSFKDCVIMKDREVLGGMRVGEE